MSTPTTVAEGRYSLLRFDADTTGSTITVDMNAVNGSTEYANPVPVKNIMFEVYNIASRPVSVTVNGKKASFTYDETARRLDVKVKWNTASAAELVIKK